MARDIDLEYYQTLAKLPAQYRTMDIFSLFVGHKKPPRLAHKDCKDWKWCFLFLLGNYNISGIYLYYLNIFIQLQPGDLLVFNSHLIWHQADQTVPVDKDRFSGVLTTHAGLLKRCNLLM